MTSADALSRTMGLCAIETILDDLEPAGDAAERDRLHALLVATRDPAGDADLMGQGAALQAFRQAHRRVSGLASRRRRRVAVAAAGVVASLGLGTGLAAAGVLPPPAQDFASNAFDVVGVHVPDSHGHRPGGVPPRHVPPASTPPVSTPPVSTPAGAPATPRGDATNGDHGRPGDDHGSGPQGDVASHDTATPGDVDTSSGERHDDPDPGRATDASTSSSAVHSDSLTG